MISESEQMADLSAIIRFIRKHYKSLLLYSVCGALAGFTLSLFIQKEYTSQAVVFPPSSTSIDNSIEFPNFGYDVEADRLIQILHSQEIRDSVTKRFDLLKVFDIDSTEADWLDKLNKKYFKNIRFERGTSMSVMITAKACDPELAAGMVNYILHLTDRLREKIYKTNINTAYTSALRDYALQRSKLDSAEKRLIADLQSNKLSSLLMMLPDAQIAVDFEKLSASGISSSNMSLGPEIMAFKEIYELTREFKTRYIKIKKSFDNPIPKLYVINYAEPNYKKVFPSYSLNALLGALSGLFLAFLFALFKPNHDWA
ncbi:MAG TPA: Wzz/FepE/Etk N-terminal domain-containing protein [Bacteroidia bacterium]|nr:Wzz/FepE/Etk N-terminal domain-containing protein [Bacteroidia bacterium]